MKKLIALFVLSFIMVLVPAGNGQAEKPLIGTMALEFNLKWPGPQIDIPDWVGSISIDGTEYGMAFFYFGTGKAFEEDRGMASFFQEVWRIYDWMTFDFKTQKLKYGKILLWGFDKGLVCYQNSDYTMNGNIEEAIGDFAVWQGHNVHMSGVIEWQEIAGEIAPHYAPGIFRID